MENQWREKREKGEKTKMRASGLHPAVENEWREKRENGEKTKMRATQPAMDGKRAN